MSWAVANTRVEPKGNAIIITKQASGSAKSDPRLAAFTGIALMSTKPVVDTAEHLSDPEESSKSGPRYGAIALILINPRVSASKPLCSGQGRADRRSHGHDARDLPCL